MHFSTLFTTLCFAAWTTADTAVSADYFEISNLTVDRAKSGNFTVSFTVHDPDPLTNATTICAGTWKFGTNGYPQTTYADCEDDDFSWRMESFSGFQKFTLGMQHGFSDPSIGDPPYDHVNTFGKAVVNKKNLGCQVREPMVNCTQKPAMVKAPIYAVSA